MRKPNKVTTGLWLAVGLVGVVGTVVALVAVLSAGGGIGTLSIGLFGILFFVLLNFATSQAKSGDSESHFESDGFRVAPKDEDDWDRPL